MKFTTTGLYALALDRTFDTLELYPHSLVKTISVKLEVETTGNAYFMMLTLSGMARVVAPEAPAAVSILHPGSANNYLSQLLMTSS